MNIFVAHPLGSEKIRLEVLLSVFVLKIVVRSRPWKLPIESFHQHDPQLWFALQTSKNLSDLALQHGARQQFALEDLQRRGSCVGIGVCEPPDELADVGPVRLHLHPLEPIGEHIHPSQAIDARDPLQHVVEPAPHLEQHDPDGVDVPLALVLVCPPASSSSLVHDLRSQVEHGTNVSRRLVVVFVRMLLAPPRVLRILLLCQLLAVPRQPQVPDLDVSAEVQEDVLGLQVPVHDALGVDVGETGDQLAEELPSYLPLVCQAFVRDHLG
mmetsp:Transcript_13712/g.31638  ORF Transcript_13712/g.31638 Transcript_13712/m.31638 type:complete len:269 (+) Transcript_13712:88-894(+)